MGKFVNVPVDENAELTKELSKSKFSDMLELAENITDMSVDCISTGFPQLDVILHSQKKGLPQGRDIEIFSKEPEVGKTSLGLQILKNWQSLGKRTLIVDVERTITTDYLNQLGIITKTDDPKIVAVRMAKPNTAMAAEEVLDLVKESSQIFDLIVVDSIGALDTKANLDKDTDEVAKIGAMALLLSNFLKKNVLKRATVIWMNQTRQVVGGWNPTGQIRYATMGGRALPFFGTIRLDLNIIDKQKDAEDNVYAYTVKVYTQKNKVSPQYRSCLLTYVMGEGFSVTYDYFNMGLKLNVIEKKGGWFQFGDVKIQGELTFYKRMKTNSDLFDAIKTAIEKELASAGAAGVTSNN